MDTRRVAVLVLAVLLPVPAWADRHTMECFLGLTPEKKQVLSARGSCGVVVVSLSGDPAGIGSLDPIQQQQPPVGGLGGGAMRLRAAQDTGVTSAGTGEKKAERVKKISVLVVGELAEYIAGKDSGSALDSVTGGFRGLFLGQKQIEPFLHVMWGKLRAPSWDGTATPNLGTWFFGGGADLEVLPDKHKGLVPVVRLQFDWVNPEDEDDLVHDAYGRVSFGVSFRWEPKD